MILSFSHVLFYFALVGTSAVASSLLTTSESPFIPNTRLQSRSLSVGSVITIRSSPSEEVDPYRGRLGSTASEDRYTNSKWPPPSPGSGSESESSVGTPTDTASVDYAYRKPKWRPTPPAGPKTPPARLLDDTASENGSTFRRPKGNAKLPPLRTSSLDRGNLPEAGPPRKNLIKPPAPRSGKKITVQDINKMTANRKKRLGDAEKNQQDPSRKLAVAAIKKATANRLERLGQSQSVTTTVTGGAKSAAEKGTQGGSKQRVANDGGSAGARPSTGSSRRGRKKSQNANPPPIPPKPVPATSSRPAGVDAKSVAVTGNTKSAAAKGSQGTNTGRGGRTKQQVANNGGGAGAGPGTGSSRRSRQKAKNKSQVPNPPKIEPAPNVAGVGNPAPGPPKIDAHSSWVKNPLSPKPEPDPTRRHSV